MFDHGWKITAPGRGEKGETSSSSTNSPEGNDKTIGQNANNSTADKNQAVIEKAPGDTSKSVSLKSYKSERSLNSSKGGTYSKTSTEVKNSSKQESKNSERDEPYRKRQVKKLRKTSISLKKRSNVRKAQLDQTTKATGKSENHVLNRWEMLHEASKPTGEDSESTKQNEKNIKPQVVIRPSQLAWKSIIEVQQIEITNPTKDRIAVKIKCSNNRIYRVDPVYSFIDPGCSLPLNVTRCISSNKTDKLVFVTMPATMENKDPKLLFEQTRSASIRQPSSLFEDYDMEDLFLL